MATVQVKTPHSLSHAHTPHPTPSKPTSQLVKTRLRLEGTTSSLGCQRPHSCLLYAPSGLTKSPRLVSPSGFKSLPCLNLQSSWEHTHHGQLTLNAWNHFLQCRLFISPSSCKTSLSQGSQLVRHQPNSLWDLLAMETVPRFQDDRTALSQESVLCAGDSGG